MATNPRDLLIRPIITEKAMQGIAAKKYTFEVAKSATKIDIARAVEELFKVHVLDVNMINTLPKKKRVGKY